MARRAKLPQYPVRAGIDSLSHDGRGVARVDGKVVFVDGALPGESVEIVYTGARRRHDEARVHAVLTPSPDRVQARCAHFGVCGGCALQHLAPAAQLQAKQRVLFDNLERLGGVVAARRLAPVTGPVWGYRHKARLGVKHVDKKGRVLVGFRERSKPYVADLHNCPVLHPDFGERLDAFAALVSSLSIVRQLPQIEVAMAQGSPRAHIALLVNGLLRGIVPSA